MNVMRLDARVQYHTELKYRLHAVILGIVALYSGLGIMALDENSITGMAVHANTGLQFNFPALLGYLAIITIITIISFGVQKMHPLN